MEVSSNMLMAILIAGGVLVALIAIFLAFGHSRRERELTHAERIKALEMGQPLPDDPQTARLKLDYGSNERSEKPSSGAKSLASQCYTTTGWVSGLGFLFAVSPGAQEMVKYFIAVSAGAVGVTGLICGTVLASKQMSFSPTQNPSKPRFDPEAV